MPIHTFHRSRVPNRPVASRLAMSAPCRVVPSTVAAVSSTSTAVMSNSDMMGVVSGSAALEHPSAVAVVEPARAIVVDVIIPEEKVASSVVVVDLPAGFARVVRFAEFSAASGQSWLPRPPIRGL